MLTLLGPPVGGVQAEDRLCFAQVGGMELAKLEQSDVVQQFQCQDSFL